MFPFAFLAPFLVASLQLPTLSAAFSWHLTTTPTQCSDLSISIVGSDGQPPYRVLVIPTGPSPLANNADVRPIIDQAFDANSTSISFPINYPANSRFVAVVSDATGFGTGGASVETQVANSNDTSCFDPNKTWSAQFYYGIGTDNQLTQCSPTRVWWNATNAQGTASFVGVVPGGECIDVEPDSSISTVQGQGPGFAWTPSIRGGTSLIIVGGDNRGMGTAGSAWFSVHPSNDTSCLDNQSPSSTPGTPAGSLATNTVTSGNSNAATSTNAVPNVGVIVGAAVGGIIGLMVFIAFIVLSYYCLRQDGRRTRRLTKHVPAPTVSSIGRLSSPVSQQLSGYTRHGTSIATAPDDPLAHYHPEPFGFPGGAGTYNNGYPYGGPGYVGGAAPGAASVVSPRSRLTSITSGSGGMSDTSSQVGPRYARSPSSHGGGNPALQPVSRLPSVTSGSARLYDTSSQVGSRYGSPSVISSASGPVAGTSKVPYENMVPRDPPPPFTPSNMTQNPPRGDVKYTITNP